EGGVQIGRTGSGGAALGKRERGASDLVIDKHRHSAFHGTDLDLRLRSLRRESVVLTGVNTNVCVEATARDACALDYWTLVVSDATGAYTSAEHESGLHNIGTSFRQAVASPTYLEVWS